MGKNDKLPKSCEIIPDTFQKCSVSYSWATMLEDQQIYRDEEVVDVSMTKIIILVVLIHQECYLRISSFSCSYSICSHGLEKINMQNGTPLRSSFALNQCPPSKWPKPSDEMRQNQMYSWTITWTNQNQKMIWYFHIVGSHCLFKARTHDP